MYRDQQRLLFQKILDVLHSRYGIEQANVVIEQPPDLAMGEFATPVAFDLARRLRKPPRLIAGEIVEALSPLEGFLSFEVAGAGYINGRLDRGQAAARIAKKPDFDLGSHLHCLVEHTSINPNKAAHVGHLRNAVLGDSFVRLLVTAGNRVDVQNYIDNTGVQVADIVVGLTRLESHGLAAVRKLLDDLKTQGKRVDYYCWDLYARVSQWYEASPDEKAERRKIRLETLHAIESGGNEPARIADLISTEVLRRHLETMLRLGIEYDFLPREREILDLKFWESAFEQLKAKGVVYLETAGKNKGCWVMRRAGSGRPAEGVPDLQSHAAGAEPDEDAKVIVRSNGTVTYVGKDIAYHLWKFGLLGRDFGYQPFFDYADRRAWISTVDGEADHPDFGGAQAIYNVIDSRQQDPQANVMEALRGLGYEQAAAHYTHFSYEMVALTPRCAEEMGYVVAEADRGRPFIEVSGRKGFGVKADDLIDRLIAAAGSEVESRHPERSLKDRRRIAEEIAVGALRYFMLKFTRGSVIAFDFRDALNFEGETGPYVQYAVVRARSIFRKGKILPGAVLEQVAKAGIAPSAAGLVEDEGLWELWIAASKMSLVLEQTISTAEPAYLAKHAFQIAQLFNNFYHRHPILAEEDPGRRQFLLASAAVAERALVTALGWMGIAAPEVM